MIRKYFALTAMMAMLLVVVSCDSEPEQNRSVVSIASFNENVSLISDTWEQGKEMFDESTGAPILYDDHIRADLVPVLFHNRPYANNLIFTEPSAPHGDFLITRYRVEWVSVNGGPTLPTYNGGISVQVPTGEFVEAYVMIVDFQDKATPPLSDLCYVCANAGGEILMQANVTFWGHEIGTTRETTVEASIGVVFVDLVQETRN